MLLRAISNALKHFKPALPAKGAIFAFIIIVAVGVSADLWSKQASFAYLDNIGLFQTPVIEGFFNLVKAENTGAAWSSFQGQKFFLIGVSFVALTLIVLVFFTGQIVHRITFIAVSLFAAGIIGNLYDRIFNDGKVRDFLDFYISLNGREQHWPAFNIADSMLCVAVALMVISNLFHASPKKTDDK